MITTSHEPVMEDREEVRRFRRGGRVQYERVTVQRPTIVGHYTRHMGGVDLFDQFVQYYSFARKTRRWTHKLLMYLLQLGIQNSYILYMTYSPDRKKLSHAQFLEMAACHLMEFNEDVWPYSGETVQRTPDLPLAQRAIHVLQRGARRPAVPAEEEEEDEENIDDPDIPHPESPRPDPATASPGAPVLPPAPAATPERPAEQRPQPAAPAPERRRQPAAPAPERRPQPAAPAPDEPSVDAPHRPTPPSRRVVDPPCRLVRGQDHSLQHIADNKQKRCRVCHMSGRRKDTRFECVTCKIPLCRTENCSHKYHTLMTYWTSPPAGTAEGRRSRVRYQ